MFTHDFIGKTREIRAEQTVQRTTNSWLKKNVLIRSLSINGISLKGQLHQQHLKLQLTTYKIARKNFTVVNCTAWKYRS